MNRILLVILMGFPIISHWSNAEHIEISTGIPMALTTPTIDSKSPPNEYSGNQFLRAVENYLAESTNVKQQPSNPSVDYIGQPLYPVYPRYNAAGSINTSVVPIVSDTNATTNYFSLIVPVLKATLKAGLQIIEKISYFLIKGSGILTIGGIITTVICYFTSICTVKYNGLKSQKDLDNGAIRAFMRPDKLASLATLVQDAISKYQTLQKSAP